jgi:small subunit ribosomal protein S7
MPRRKRVIKRPKIAPDPVYGSELVSRLINRVMWDGKKTVATKIVIRAIRKASEQLGVEPLEMLNTALENVRPKVEVKSMRIGGASYQVPVEPYPARSVRLGLTWMVTAARSMKGKPMEEKLAEVIAQSFNNEGPAVAKRNAVHQTAAGNRAFAHLAYKKKKK